MENNTVNVKNLPQTEEVLNGDYMIIEKPKGSYIIDFRDFVIGPTNTSFYNALVTNIRAISTYNTSLCATIANTFDQVNEVIDTKFQQVTANWFANNPALFTTYGEIVLQKYTAYGTNTFTSPLQDIFLENININQLTIDPNDPNPLRAPILSIASQLDTTTNLYTYTVSVSTLSAVGAMTKYRYMVIKPYLINEL